LYGEGVQYVSTEVDDLIDKTIHIDEEDNEYVKYHSRMYPVKEDCRPNGTTREYFIETGVLGKREGKPKKLSYGKGVVQ
jgi:hypothetical protein